MNILKLIKGKFNLTIILILIIIWGIIFLNIKIKAQTSPVPSNSSYKADKFQATKGYSCSDNFTPCPSGSVNLLNDLTSSSGSLLVNSGEFNKSELVAQIRESYGVVDYCLSNKQTAKNNVCIVLTNTGDITTETPVPLKDDSPNLCLNTSKYSNNIISFFVEGSKKSDELVFYSKNAQINTEPSARVCSSGLLPSESKLDGYGPAASLGNFDSWGCCPSNYQFVTGGDLIGAPTSRAIVNETGVCCRIPDGSKKGDSNYPQFRDRNIGGVNERRCVGRDNKDIFNGKKYLQDSNGNNIITQPNWIEYSDKKEIFGDFLGFDVKSDSTRVAGDKIAIMSPTNKATKHCANADKGGCALLSVNNGKNYNVVPSNTFDNPGNTLSCNVDGGCIDNGGPIGLDETTNKFLYCKDGAAVATEAINNDPQQTIACTKSDPTNNASCRSCLNSGGLWLAVGCVDPTPLGLITGIIRIALGIMGGVSLILIIIAGIALQSGDEKRIEDAKKELIAVLSGVAVLVFSVLILRIIGVNVLDILPKGSV